MEAFHQATHRCGASLEGVVARCMNERPPMNNTEKTAAALVPLEPLTTKVVRVHGEHDPRLLDVQEALRAADLRRARELTSGFAVPDWACTSYRRLFAELRDLDQRFGG
jgi:iron-sulfur cluster repair protein YtfE (RIC family)